MRAWRADVAAARFDLAIERLRAEAGRLFDGRQILHVARGRTLTKIAAKLFWVEVTTVDGVSRLVVKVSTLGEGEARRAAKQLGRLEREHAASQRLMSLIGAEPGAGVVRALAFYREAAALVMEEARGPSLTDLVDRVGWIGRRQALARLEAGVERAGRLLAAIQRATRESGRCFSLDEMIEYVDVRLRALVQFGARGLDAAWSQRVLPVFEAARAGIDGRDLAMSLAHGDFCPGNVILEPDRAVAIDLSQVQVNSVFYDLTRFYHQLELLAAKPQFPSSVVRRLTAAFAGGYGRPAVTESPLFRLFNIQHALCHWLGRLKRRDAPIGERLYDAWVGRHHQRELGRLLA
jgi:hypothetical protein